MSTDPVTKQAPAEEVDLSSDEEGGADDSKLNRAEKRSRKAMAKLGMKAVTGIVAVKMRRGKSSFVCDAPVVYKAPGSETYVFFGEVRVEDPFAGASAAAPSFPSMGRAAAAPAASADDEEEEDETGVEPKDIETVMAQVPGVSRAKAVRALKENNGDLVNAVLAVSS